ncbi:MAG TPA: hypothetical protein VIS78_10595 [Blastocatellia bacterium]
MIIKQNAFTPPVIMPDSSDGGMNCLPNDRSPGAYAKCATVFVPAVVSMLPGYTISSADSYMLTRFAYEIGASSKRASQFQQQISNNFLDPRLWHRVCQCIYVILKIVKVESYDNQISKEESADGERCKTCARADIRAAFGECERVG